MHPRSAACVGVFLLGGSVALVSPTAAVATTAASRACHDVQLYAHRGEYGSGYTENSLNAIRTAISRGHGIETDLRTTADGKIILMHDRTITRTTSGHGSVKRLTAAQIRSHRLNDGSRVPFVSGPLAMVAAHRGGGAMLELKPGAMPRSSLRVLRSQILSRGLSRRVIVYSFDRTEVSQFRKIAPRIQTSLMRNHTEAGWKADAFVRFGGATVRPRQVSLKWARRAQKIGVPVTMWGAENAKAWRPAVRAGATRLILDHVDDFTTWCRRP